MLKKILLWIYVEICVDLITYMPTIIGRKFRNLIVRLFAKKCGKNFTAHFGVQLWGIHNMSIGDNFYINHLSSIRAFADVNIGDNVIIADHVQLLTFNHGYKSKDTPIRYQKATNHPLVVEDDVWIGAGAIINSGSVPVRIARGVVIGSNSVVTKDCDVEYGIYAGNPAKLIKLRFD